VQLILGVSLVVETEGPLIRSFVVAEEGYIRGKATCPLCQRRVKFSTRFGDGTQRVMCRCGKAALVVIRPKWDWEIYAPGENR